MTDAEKGLAEMRAHPWWSKLSPTVRQMIEDTVAGRDRLTYAQKRAAFIRIRSIVEHEMEYEVALSKLLKAMR